MKFKCVKVAKDYHELTIEANRTSYEFVLERSELRHLIEILDNSIDIGRVDEVKAIDADEYMDMLAKAKAAALSDMDEDCEMCGS